MTNKYLKKIALDNDTKNKANTFGKAWTLGTAGMVAGGLIGAKLGGTKTIGKILESKPVTKMVGHLKDWDNSLSRHALYRSLKPTAGATGGVAAGAFIGSHIGGDAGEYAGISSGMNDMKRKKQPMQKVAILTRIFEKV